MTFSNIVTNLEYVFPGQNKSLFPIYMHILQPSPTYHRPVVIASTLPLPPPYVNPKIIRQYGYKMKRLRDWCLSPLPYAGYPEI